MPLSLSLFLSRSRKLCMPSLSLCKCPPNPPSTMPLEISQTTPNHHKPLTIFYPPSYPCTLSLLFLIALLSYYTLHFSQPQPTPTLHFHQTFLQTSNNNTISSYLHSLTLHPHLAGTQPALQTSSYVLHQLTKLGLKTHIAEYQSLLSYPSQTTLSLHFPDGTFKNLYLREKHVGQIVTPYHAYSPSGSVFGKVVFANYGREQDYARLTEMGVSVNGCVVIARNGDLFRGSVVEKAYEKGAIGVLLYSDRDRFAGERDRLAGKYEEFFPADGIERGTVMDGLGDPLSPGWAGIEGAERLGMESEEVRERFPKIPSMPISNENAWIILRSLSGPEVPHEWRGALQLEGAGVGSGPTFLNFTYLAEQKMATIRNVFAMIKGKEEPDRYVLLGNHRDAWTYGAVDPNSGTAALLDIARRFSILLRQGWNPRRNILLCSWDAEEFGMIGSTEWVEQNLGNLGSKAVSYLNVDCAVQGPGFFARATPQLDTLLLEVTTKVKDPDSPGGNVHQSWLARSEGIKIERLNDIDSDFAPFLQHAGVPSVDLFYGKAYPVYHTAYDSYEWMKKFGDPLFHRHVAVSGIWGLLALRLADDPILPFDYLSYAAQLQEHAEALKNLLDSESLHPINASIQEFTAAAIGAEEEAKKLRECQKGDLLELRQRSFNDRLMLAERGFLEADGLKGRRWFKHLVYGPPKDRENKQVAFPGVADAIDQAKVVKTQQGQAALQHEIWRVARAIQRAASALRGDLT